MANKRQDVEAHDRGLPSAQGCFSPYAYRCDEEVDLRRFVVEKGHLSTPSGESPYTIVRMRPFACVLPVVEAGSAHARLVLARQFRYAVGCWQLESPAGGIEEGEEPADAAIRELREECGLLVDELVSLGYTYPSAGSTSEVAHLFAARCKQAQVACEQDRGEQIESVLASRAQMEQMLAGDGANFAHAPTAVAWLRLQAKGLLDLWMPRA